MKRHALLVSLLMLAATAFAAAQTKTVETVTTKDSTGKETTVQVTRVGSSEDITPRNNMITINPLKFILFYNISYYHRLNNTVVVGGGLETPTISGVSGWGVLAEARIYPSGKAMRGFYVAPNISFNRVGSSNDATSSDATTFSIGALLGWQWFPGDEFAIGFGLGVDYYFLGGSADDETSIDLSDYDGLAPALRFDIGYAF